MEKELSLQLGGGVTQPGQMNAGDRYVFSLQLDPIWQHVPLLHQVYIVLLWFEGILYFHQV